MSICSLKLSLIISVCCSLEDFDVTVNGIEKWRMIEAVSDLLLSSIANKSFSEEDTEEEESSKNLEEDSWSYNEKKPMCARRRVLSRTSLFDPTPTAVAGARTLSSMSGLRDKDYEIFARRSSSR